MSAIAAIHVGKRDLGLDDDTYRALLRRVTGVDSVKDMTEAQRKAVLHEMRRAGFKDRARPKPPGSANLSGTYGAIARALWLTGWNLGVVRDRTDVALLHFVERQTAISHLSWVRDAKDGRKVMEALKAWIARATGIVWPTETYARRIGKSVARARKEAVHQVQHRILGERWHIVPAEVTDAELDKRISAMGRRVRVAQGIGERIRAAKEARREGASS